MTLEPLPRTGVPDDWDRLEAAAEPPASVEDIEDPADGANTPPLVAMVAAAWGDLVTLLAVCAAALVAVVSFGYGTGLQALPWAAGVAAAWWAVAATVLLAVRRGTPGMLLAGVVFSEPVARRQVVPTLAAALLLALTAGLPALAGSRRSLLGLAAGSPPMLILKSWNDDA